MENLVGQVFGRWTVLRLTKDKKERRSVWLCECDCGVVRPVREKSLKHKQSRSCGCLQRDEARNAHLTHGMSKTKTHITWLQMKARCNNKSNLAYKDYGGRGITVCQSWNNFENFLNDMGQRPKGMSLERKDNEKGYSPENCIWATAKAQASNRRSNVVLDTPWGRMIAADAARKLGITPSTLCIRMKKWPQSRWFEP